MSPVVFAWVVAAAAGGLVGVGGQCLRDPRAAASRPLVPFVAFFGRPGWSPLHVSLMSKPVGATYHVARCFRMGCCSGSWRSCGCRRSVSTRPTRSCESPACTVCGIFRATRLVAPTCVINVETRRGDIPCRPLFSHGLLQWQLAVLWVSAVSVYATHAQLRVARLYRLWHFSGDQIGRPYMRP